MRKVVQKNMIFCSNKCNMFDNILEEELSRKDELKEEQCFENCLGKHSDSVEHGLHFFSKKMNEQKMQDKSLFTHDTEVNSEPGKPVYDASYRGQ